MDRIFDRGPILICFIFAILATRTYFWCGLIRPRKWTAVAFSRSDQSDHLPTLVFIPKCTVLHFSTLNLIPQSLDHSHIASKSFWRFRLSSSRLVIDKCLDSPANSFRLLFTASGKSLIYITKRIGTRTEPWDTPLNNASNFLKSPQTISINQMISFRVVIFFLAPLLKIGLINAMFHAFGIRFGSKNKQNTKWNSENSIKFITRGLVVIWLKCIKY